MNVVAFEARCNAHSPANAECGKPFLRIASLHFVKQRRQDARAGGTNRVADGNGTAIDVDLRRIPTEIFVNRASLRSKGFVGFYQIEVLFFPAGFLERSARSRDWPR